MTQYTKEYYKKHKDKILNQQREYRIKNNWEVTEAMKRAIKAYLSKPEIKFKRVVIANLLRNKGKLIIKKNSKYKQQLEEYALQHPELTTNIVKE